MLPTTAAERAPRPARRALIASAYALIALTVLALVAHTKPFRPLLGRLMGAGGGAAGCPVSLAGLTPDEIEAHRISASATLLGSATARTRAAGPFTMGKTTREEVDQWAKATSVTCGVELSGAVLRCAAVPARALASSDDAPVGADTFFRFSPAGVLVGLDVMRAPCDGACNERLAGEIVARVERDVGPATTKRGPFDRAYFDASGVRAASVEFRFTDYAVDVSVTRLALAGALTLREQYRAVSPPAQ